MIGGFFVNWMHHNMWEIDCCEGVSLEKLLLELGTLESKALGSVKYGTAAEEIRTGQRGLLR